MEGQHDRPSTATVRWVLQKFDTSNSILIIVDEGVNDKLVFSSRLCVRTDASQQNHAQQHSSSLTPANPQHTLIHTSSDVPPHKLSECPNAKHWRITSTRVSMAHTIGIGCKRHTHFVISGMVITQMHIRKAVENFIVALAFHPIQKDFIH